MSCPPPKVTPEMYADYLGVSGKGWLCEIDGEVVGFSVASLGGCVHLGLGREAGV
jgi:hypothetical protein